MNQNLDKISADLVVYGKIFTSENNQIVEAFAVKDGKYIYVGDKKGAEAFIHWAHSRPVLDRSCPCCRQEGSRDRSDVHLRFRLELHHFHGKYTYPPAVGCYLQ